MNALRVAVVGAGPGGLAVSATLARLGVDVTVFERWNDIRALGGGLALRPPASKALEYLGLNPAEIGAPSQPRYLRPDGRTLAVFPALPSDERMADFPLYLSTLRSGLYASMRELVPVDRLIGGRRARRVTQDDHAATVWFEDGSTFVADIVIGADGINSVVRAELEPPAPVREHNILAWIGYTLFDGIEDRTSARLVIDPSGLQISCAPILHNGQRGWHWWALQAWDPALTPPEGQAKAEHVAAIVRNGPEPIPTLVRETDTDDIHPWIIRDRPPLPRWADERVVVLGDAAHPTSPYAGYGTGMAIVDGFILGCLLAGADTTADIPAVLKQFEAERKAPADSVVEYAYAMGRTIHHAPLDQLSARDDALDNTSMLQDRIDAQFGETLVNEFLRIHELGELHFPRS